MPCGAFSTEENEALRFGSSLLHKLGYPNPSVWWKLGFLTLASSTHYFSLLEKVLAFSSSINKRFRNLHWRLDFE